METTIKNVDSVSPASSFVAESLSKTSTPETGSVNEEDEILSPNDYKYYHNHLDKAQFSLTLINCAIYLIKLLYSKEDVEINPSNLRFFILQILKRSKTSIQVLQIACFYLLKLVKLHDSELIKNPKHLFLGLIILASKFNQDANYSFKTWVKMLGMDPEDIKQIKLLKNLEVSLLQSLDYNLFVSHSTYENWCNILLIFGYDFIKTQHIITSSAKSEVVWEVNDELIQSKLSKWESFFDHLNLANLKEVEIKFINYYLSQFNTKVFITNSLFAKRKIDDVDEAYDNDNKKVLCMKLPIPKIKSFHQVVFVIVLLWIATFILHERIIPLYVANMCEWTEVPVKKDPVQGFRKQDDPDTIKEMTTNVLFIADPQLIDSHTYPGRNSLLLKLSQHTVDTYLKKNYKALVKHLDPVYIFFLGDYLDNGRYSSNSYFLKEYTRFKNIFPHKKYGFKKDKNFFINLPGNHDIGIGDGVKQDSRKRFSKKFGKLNTITSLNGVDVISLDTLSLMSGEEDINSDCREFLDKNFGESISKLNPRILLTHVPLFRDPQEKTCGPLREGPPFRLTKGYQYQLVVDSKITQDILDRIQPDLVFSGDDHDYCDIQHNELTREITVKSISMAMGIWKPAVQVLSFANPDDKFQYSTKMCYLPTPYYNIVHYVVLAVASGLLLLYWGISQSLRLGYGVLPLHNITSKKVSNFIKDQESDSDSSFLMHLPNYTNTKNDASKLQQFWTKTSAKLKRFHALLFLKQALGIGAVVIGIYIVFYKTI